MVSFFVDLHFIISYNVVGVHTYIHLLTEKKDELFYLH